ncbi:AAA family ATPase [Halonotius sp. GCM10025705]|uniref:AAA family ATPase n=2 Tax=Halonotius sp. GCM10025705 TaxID=3252678 RepID=UPI003614CA9A
MFGPDGAGKRRFLRATAGELGKHGYEFIQITSLHEYRPPGPEMITSLFEECVSNQPVTILLDCLDGMFSDDVIRTLGQQLDTLREDGSDIVVLSSMADHQLHGHLQEYLPHMDVVVEIERPEISRREAIIRNRLETVGGDISGLTPEEYDIKRLARETDQFGTKDLQRLMRRLAATATTTAGTAPPLDESDIVSVIKQVNTERVEKLVDEETLTNVDVPEVTFDDVGGHEEAKRRLLEQVEQALTHEDIGAKMGVEFGSGILLHGPPGTGKTMLVRALANELDYTFIPVNSSLLKRNAQQKIPGLFYRAQRNAPTILFFDEFDLLGGERGNLGEDTTVNTLLTELDGVEQLNQVMVIAATNRPKSLDPALLRPGRFDYHLEIDRPKTSVQEDIFETHTRDIPLTEDVTPEWFAEMTETVTGAEIAAICERAVTIGMRDDDVDEMVLSRSQFEDAYTDFKRGRLFTEDLNSSPAFQ